MHKISRSPNRHDLTKKFLQNSSLLQKIISDADNKFNDPKSRENNMEWDLLTTDWILEKVRSNDSYAQNLYAVMCNNEFIKNEMWPVLKDQRWSCSWRHSGRIIADMQQKGDYSDWYCSGITNETDPAQGTNVPEGFVTEEIEQDLNKLGWIIVKYNGE